MTQHQHITLQPNSKASRQYFATVAAQLAEGKTVKLAFNGTSMLPTLQSSDRLLVESLHGEPQKGDVLLFRHDGHYVVHRLVDRQGDMYLLQGDNNRSTESVGRQDLMARVSAVERVDGTVVDTTSPTWARLSRKALRRSASKRLASHWMGQRGRRQLRPWYFAALAILMWAPLNGIDIPLDNYILGLRADHLLHASVFIPCTLFLMDFYKRLGAHGHKWAVWGTAVAIGLLTEGVQYLLPYRGYDVNDLIANTLGVTLGWLLILLVCLRRHDCKS